MIPILFSPDFSSDFSFISNIHFQKDLIYHCLLLIFFYSNYLILIPKFYFKNEFIIYLLSILVILVIINIVPEIITKLINQPPDFRGDEPFREGRPGPFMKGHPGPPPRGFVFMYIKNMFQFFFVGIVGLMIQTNRRLKLTEKNRLATELSYLKSQINPHFLFNTLNSIYSLAIVGSNNTANAVVKLSNMMRYVLNDASREWVSLDQEINYISNYIELQELRFAGSINIRYQIQGETEGKTIAPLLIIPFIENAFKYGVNAEQDSSINVHISIKQNMIHVLILNKKVDYTQTSMDSNGIGIENTKSRLAILYPNKHILAIDDREDAYEVSLILHFA